MDETRFDHLTRSLTDTASRRALLGGFAAALGLATLRFPVSMAARKKRKNTNKKKPPALNQFGCLNVGQKCRGNSANCCSGICQGKKPKKGKKDTSICVAHDEGGCQADEDICAGNRVKCGVNGACLRTTGNASHCSSFVACTVCRKDADCEADFGPGAACIPCAGECEETGDTLCSTSAV